MGRVFRWAEVKQGQIPDSQDFKFVAQELRGALSRSMCVQAAALLGSVARDEPTARSDIDCGVVFDAGNKQEAYELMHRLGAFAASRHVHVSWVLCNSRVAKTRLHHYGPSFRKHVARCLAVGGHIKGDFLAGFADSISEHEEIESYLRFKMFKLEAGWAEYTQDSDGQKAAYLQKVLESALHISRKVLAYHGWLTGDSKLEVVEQYLAHMPAALNKQRKELLEIDSEYTHEFQDQRFQTNEADYAGVLAFLESKVLRFHDFAQANLEEIDKVVR